MSVLYVVVSAVVIGLALYVLVLTVVFLRLRIPELKRAQPPRGDTHRQ
jgi:hypothetical protein